MKKLSIEQKAKRYDEALEKVRQLCAYPTTNPFISDLQDLFPELKESEDERIRKGLLYVIEHHPTLPTEEAEKYIAWLEKQGEHANFRNKIKIGDKVTRNEDGVLVNLSQLNRVAKKDEKQGEQKPTENSGKKSEDVIEEKDMTEYKKGFECGKQRVLKYPEDFNLCKKSAAWSEEDKEILKDIITDVKFEGYNNDMQANSYKKINWLKSLKNRCTWKPSDEQMDALVSAIDVMIDNRGAGDKNTILLSGLYHELKKLREESYGI